MPIKSKAFGCSWAVLRSSPVFITIPYNCAINPDRPYGRPVMAALGGLIRERLAHPHHRCSHFAITVRAAHLLRSRAQFARQRIGAGSAGAHEPLLTLDILGIA